MDLSSLRTAEAVQNNSGEGGELFDFNSIPPGYRFNPTDGEIIAFYLRKKIDHQPLPPNKIVEVDLYAYDPDELAARYEPSGNDEWFYFTPRDRKYRNGQRPNRAINGHGYWKATGVDKEIKFEDRTVGYRRALVFYRGGAQNGVKTNWIMHEYTVAKPPGAPRRSGVNDMRLDDCVLCRVYRKDRKIGKRSRHESGLDESGPSISTIPRLELNPDPNDANHPYEEQYYYNSIQIPLQTQQPQPIEPEAEAEAEAEPPHSVKIEAGGMEQNGGQTRHFTQATGHEVNEIISYVNPYEEQCYYNTRQMPLQNQPPQPRTETLPTPQEHDHFALQWNTEFPILDPSVLMPLPTPNEFGGQGLDNFNIMNGAIGNSSFDAWNNIDFGSVTDWDAAFDFGNVLGFNDAAPMPSNKKGNDDRQL